MGNKKIALVLAGCGVFDGSEIHEATLTMLAIAKQGHTYQIFAPDMDQHHVVNHISGEETNEKRNVLVEAARIARGDIKDLAEYKAEDFDGLIFPGGFGVAKNLCSFAISGIDCTVNPQVEKAIKTTHKIGKPIGALCISPVLVARVLGNVEVTIGSDKETAAAIKELGGRHQNTGHGETVVDSANKIVTSPCYMLDASIKEIAEGSENLVKELLKLA